MQKFIITISTLILLLSLENHSTTGAPSEHRTSHQEILPLTQHSPQRITLSNPNAASNRIRRSAIAPESLSQALLKLKQVITMNGGFSKVNSDYQSAYNVMYSEEVQSDPILREAVKFDEKGHVCSVALCNSIGQSQISLGACTAQFCHCGSGKAFVKSCGPGTVYDAFAQNCNWLDNVEYCT